MMIILSILLVAILATTVAHAHGSVRQLPALPTITGFDLYDAATDLKIDSLEEGDQIAVCATQLTIQALSPDASKVLMVLKDSSSNVLVSNLEVASPFTLGQNVGPDYYPVPQLTVGSYTICATPKLADNTAGATVCLDFEILPCPIISNFDLYEAGSDLYIKTLVENDQVYTCASQLTIEAITLGDAFHVLMILYNGNGKKLTKNLEKQEPWTLGQNVGPDYYAVPSLKVPGKYKICATPYPEYGPPGATVCIDFELFPCENTCGNADWSCYQPLTLCGTGGLFGQCVCDLDTEGNKFCWANDYCASLTTCTSSADCSGGRRCFVDTCCVIGVCLEHCLGRRLLDAAERDMESSITAAGLA